MYIKTHPSSYSIAIHKIAEEENKVKIYHNEFGKLREIIDHTPELINFLKNSLIPLEDRFKLIDEVLVDFEPTIIRSLKVIVERNMAFILKKIIVDFLKITNKELRIKYARVISAFPLNQIEITLIKTKLQKQTSRIVELTTEVDPNLISGFQIIFANELFEDNLEKDLEKLKYKIMKGKELDHGK